MELKSRPTPPCAPGTELLLNSLPLTLRGSQGGGQAGFPWRLPRELLLPLPCLGSVRTDLEGALPWEEDDSAWRVRLLVEEDRGGGGSFSRKATMVDILSEGHEGGIVPRFPPQLNFPQEVGVARLHAWDGFFPFPFPAWG